LIKPGGRGDGKEERGEKRAKDGRRKREEGSKRRKETEKRKKRVELGELFLLNPFNAGKDPFHSAFGQPAKGFLQDLRREVFFQKSPHFHAGFPAMDEIAAGKVGLDPAAVIKSQHGPHLGAIGLKMVVFLNHANLSKSQKDRHCERSEAISYYGN
jgi:hypothetical protein